MVAFTEYSKDMTPFQVLKLISQLNNIFDAVVKKHGAQKLNVVGDGFLALCGAPNEMSREESARRLTNVALEFLAAVHNGRFEEPMELGGEGTGTTIDYDTEQPSFSRVHVSFSQGNKIRAIQVKDRAPIRIRAGIATGDVVAVVMGNPPQVRARADSYLALPHFADRDV